MSSNIEAEIVSGELPGKNIKLEAAMKELHIDRKKFRLYHIGSRSFIDTEEYVNIFEMVENNQRSHYYESFRDGATIYPRQFWFVDIMVPPTRVGFNPKKTNIKSSTRSRDLAKEGYKDVEITGQVESQFLFHVVTGSELVPFGHLELPICVLPIERSAGNYRLIKSDEAMGQGNRGLRDWLVEVERVWESKRGEKVKNVDVYTWLDYSHKLTNQSSRTNFKVLYNASGTYLVACVVKNQSGEAAFNGVKLRTSGLVADCTTFNWDTDEEDEAYYVSAFLNAPIIDRLIKPLQSVGDFGERHIHKKVLELPIPRFDPDNKLHRELSDIAKSCESKVLVLATNLGAKYGSLGKIRQEIKSALKDDLTKINSLALSALNAGRPQRLEDLLKKDH